MEYCLPIKTHKRKKFTNIVKPLINTITLLYIILLILTIIYIFSFSFKKNILRELSSKSEPINPVILIFFIFFVLFIFLTLYMICELKNIESEQLSEEIKKKVWIFIYLTNDGFLLSAVTYSPMVNDLSVGYLTLIGSGFIFVIGTIFFIKDLVAQSGGNCFGNFIVFQTLLGYFRIPCDYIWKFLALTDPCCLITEVKNESDLKCAECWNPFVYLLKRFVIIISMIIYYMSLFYITIAFLIVKFLYWVILRFIDLCKNCKKNNNNTMANIGNTGVTEININNKGNIQNIPNQNFETNVVYPNPQNIENVENVENIENNVEYPMRENSENVENRNSENVERSEESNIRSEGNNIRSINDNNENESIERKIEENNNIHQGNKLIIKDDNITQNNFSAAPNFQNDNNPNNIITIKVSGT